MKSVTVRHLKSGIKLVAYHMPTAPAVAFSLLIGPGYAHEPECKQGLADVLASMFELGNTRLFGRKFAEHLEGAGINLDIGGKDDCLEFYGICRASNIRKMISEISSVIKYPKFPIRQLPGILARKRLALRQVEDSPSTIAAIELKKFFIRPPFNRTGLGDMSSLSSIRLDDVRDFSKLVSPQTAVLAVAGNFDLRELVDTLEVYLDSWPSQIPSQNLATSACQPGSLHIARDSAQVHFCLAFDFIQPTNPDYHAARMAVELLSGGLVSRLAEELREKRGLVYEAAARVKNYRGMTCLLVHAGASPQNAQEALRVIGRELALMYQAKDSGFAHELQAAKLGLETAIVTAFEKPQLAADALAWAVWNTGQVHSVEENIADYNAVSEEDLQGVASRHPLTNPTLVSVGPVALSLDDLNTGLHGTHS